MPIRSDLRKQFYGLKWQTVTRPGILKRAGGRVTKRGRYLGGAKCEECGKPDRNYVFTFSNRTTESRPIMFWLAAKGDVWRDQFGRQFPQLKLKGLPRKIWVELQVCHLNHTPGDDREENLKALCAWHHLNWDALHHKETRCSRKDLERPLLSDLIGSMPRRAAFADDLDYCRAMQRWAHAEVDPANPQRSICIDDWFAEELLIEAERLWPLGSGAA